MQIRLSKNSFVRHYGPYTHVFNQLNKCDATYQDAEVFLDVITRVASPVDELIKKVVSTYEGTSDSGEIQADFREFVSSLLEQGIVVAGENESELSRKDIEFTYKIENPHTSADVSVWGKEDTPESEGHALLHDYFEQHPTPFALHLDLTSMCNERCVHCYVPRDKHFFMDMRKALEVICDFRKMGGLAITLSGGECLLHPDFDTIIRAARNQDLSISVLSNLTLLTDEKAQLLKEMNLSLVQVSLYSMNPTIHDSITRLKGSFDKTKAAIEKLHSLDVPVQISCPCMRSNYKGFKEVLDYAYSLKMKAYTDFIMMARSDGTQDNLEQRLSPAESETLMSTIFRHDQEMKVALESDFKQETPETRANKPLCGVGIDSICLNADGNYYACSGFQGYPLGNCSTTNLKTIWEHSPQINYLRNLRGKDIPQCIHCQSRNYCSMCLVRNFNETGDMLKVTDHFCKIAHINREMVLQSKA
jgi:radical SAM protein with 4Fe4S-binding SPASM domain